MDVGNVHDYRNCECRLLKFRELGPSVYQLYHSSKGPLGVVLKEYRGANFAKRCKKEYDFLKELKHNHIVRCLGKPILMGDSAFFPMEWMTGGSLLTLYKSRKLKTSEARRYLRQILIAVEHCHNSGIIHGDIKCSNVFLEGNKCKLGDFGRAIKLPEGLNEPGGVGDIYSPRWRAPEVYLKDSTYGLPADIYSIGCLTLELLTRAAPFNTEPERLQYHNDHQICEYIPSIPSTLPEGAKNFIRRCIERNPSKRPTVSELLMDEYVQDLDEALDSVTSEGTGIAKLKPVGYHADCLVSIDL
ncbi:hypothetical protein R1flu_004692 [Riccia fluitans]|uniref:Protein kinase domain-containing protein n=1 Tax=Riccia fluitans TaxID=41844 RepID=A0ABD1YR10_9MARC